MAVNKQELVLLLLILCSYGYVGCQRIGPLDGYMKSETGVPLEEAVPGGGTASDDRVPSKDIPQYPLFITSPKARTQYIPAVEVDDGGYDDESYVYLSPIEYTEDSLPLEFELDPGDRMLTEDSQNEADPPFSNTDKKTRARDRDGDEDPRGQEKVRPVVSGSQEAGENGDWFDFMQTLEDGPRAFFHSMLTGNRSATCQVIPVDPTIHHKVEEHIEMGAKVIKYRLHFKNYSSNPMENITWIYDPTVWSRVSTYHGQTLVSLAFNYGILSLMTLTFGVVSLPVQFRDDPPGCFGKQSEQNKTRILLEVLVRDFQIEKDEVLEDPNSVCYKPIHHDGGYVNFGTRCCKLEQGGMIACQKRVKNIWLRIIDSLLSGLILFVLLFGPMYTTGPIAGQALESIPYVVKLKQPLQRKICIVRGEDRPRIRAHRTLDLRHTELCQGGKKLLADLPVQMVIPIKINQFDINVHYDTLQQENIINVGLKNSLFKAIFACELRHIGPFKACCKVNMFNYLTELPEVSWIALWQIIGKLLLVLLLPAPYYLRLLIYYHFEHPEIQHQTHIVNKLGLSLRHDFNILHHLTPTHPWLLSVYLIYIITILFLVMNQRDLPHYRNILVNSFKDLSKLSWLRAFGNVVEHWLWPFSRFGCMGVLLAPFYWAAMLPLYIALYLLYCTPLIYLLCRIIFRAMPLLFIRRRGTRKSLTPSGWRQKLRRHLRTLEHTLLLQDDDPEEQDREAEKQQMPTVHLPLGFKRLLSRFIGISLLIYNIIGIAVIASECVGFMAKTFAFTLMGVVVNASTVLKYVTLIILIVIYSYDCYNNVYKKYLKLNKSLFSEIKGRMSDQIDAVTSLPAHLQENRGFKTVENDEQAEHEQPDELAVQPLFHWQLNDLIMFIDNDDMPRIPKKLFSEVCSIRVTGSPGPIYRSLMQATGKFLTLFVFLLFIFMVVLSFGEVYNISSTNQMLATLAGGFVPFIMRTMMTPSKPDTELATVSFKSKLDEIIQNFRQKWPMNDFYFEVEAPPSARESDASSGGLDQSVAGQADVLGSSFGTAQMDHLKVICELSSHDNSSYKSLLQSEGSSTVGSKRTSSTGSTLIQSSNAGSTFSLVGPFSTTPAGSDKNSQAGQLENSYSSARMTTPDDELFHSSASRFQFPTSRRSRQDSQSTLDILNNRINAVGFGTHTAQVHRPDSQLDLVGSRPRLSSAANSCTNLSAKGFNTFSDSRLGLNDVVPPLPGADSPLPSPVFVPEMPRIQPRNYYSSPLISMPPHLSEGLALLNDGATDAEDTKVPPFRRLRKLSRIPRQQNPPLMNPLFKPASRGETVDILIILPESEVQDPLWCKRWSDLFIYQTGAVGKHGGVVPL